MNIGAAAQASGLSAKMIRHYETLGLLPAPGRSDSGYRRYGQADLERLRFIRQARDLGFSLETIGDLLSLWNDPHRSSREVRTLAQGHIATLQQRRDELDRMIAALQELVRCCHGDERPQCPILDSLGGHSA